MTLDIGGTYDWGSTILFSPTNATNKNLTFASSDETVATVDENGVITGVVNPITRLMGACWITATSEDGEHIAKILIGCDEGAMLTYFELEKEDSYSGNSYEFSAPTGLVFVTWYPGNPAVQDVADINQNGTYSCNAYSGKMFFAVSKTADILQLIIQNSVKGEFLFKAYDSAPVFELYANNQSLTKITTNVYYLECNNCPELTNVVQHVPNGITYGSQIFANSSALSKESIAANLARYAASEQISGYVDVTQGTNALYSTWSAQAKADAAALILRNWTISYS